MRKFGLPFGEEEDDDEEEDKKDKDKAKDKKTKLEAVALRDERRKEFKWKRNVKIRGGRTTFDRWFQTSIRHPGTDPLSVPTFSGLGWWAIPHLGRYGDPYEISFPLLLVELPVKNIKAIVPREIGRAVQQECRDRSRMPSSA
eukprot:TRINITY_DN69772_c0_g1_i3.p1 TRINITY_DN69772_c0_g1~~TRINITY_DN69772_c0_g1_i3.p1  ORF type:complete len:159 (-),score=23.41 TRINITY_DN69772_c0_g1_i3:10-438(-)